MLETPRVCDGQRGLVSCGSQGCKESDMTEQLNWTEVSIRTEIPNCKHWTPFETLSLIFIFFLICMYLKKKKKKQSPSWNMLCAFRVSIPTTNIWVPTMPRFSASYLLGKPSKTCVYLGMGSWVSFLGETLKLLTCKKNAQCESFTWDKMKTIA